MAMMRRTKRCVSPRSIAPRFLAALAVVDPTAACEPDLSGADAGPPECMTNDRPVFFALAYPADEEDDHLAILAGEVVALGEDTCSGGQLSNSVGLGDPFQESQQDSFTFTIDDGASCGSLTLYIAGRPFDLALGDAVTVRAEQPRSFSGWPFELELRRNGELLAYMVDTEASLDDETVPPEIQVRNGAPSCDSTSDYVMRHLRATRNGQTIDVAPASTASLEGFTVIHSRLSEYVGAADIRDGTRYYASFAFVRE